MIDSHRTRVSHGVIAVALAALVPACGVFNKDTSRQMVPASGQPQTEATVLIRPAEGGVNVVTITAHDVAPPELVAPGATTYVVWFRAKEQPAVNVGELRIDANRRGFLQTTTEHDSFTVLITAERSRDAEAPLGRAAFTIAASTE